MKKILLFIKLPPPTTGATLMNKYVAESEILKKNFDIRTIGISYNSSVSQMGSFSIIKFVKIFKYSLKLIKEMLFFKPDLVYFQISPLGFAFLRDSLYVLIIKLFRGKIVFHIHGKGILRQLNNPIKKRLYKFVFINQEVITLSKLLDYDIQSVFQKKIYHVSNGIPIIKYDNKVRDKNSTIEILYLSNLIKSKGILDFISAMLILRKKGINFIANIVGKEADISKKELEKIINENHLSGYVDYLGPKYSEEKTQIFLMSDIFVFPTKYPNETFGLVNIEAMQFELPVLSTCEGAIPEIIENGVTGFLVDKNYPEQIAEKIEYLINNPEKRIEMGKAGRKKFLEKYTIDKFEENMKNVFNEILSKEK